MRLWEMSFHAQEKVFGPSDEMVGEAADSNRRGFTRLAQHLDD